MQYYIYRKHDNFNLVSFMKNILTDDSLICSVCEHPSFEIFLLYSKNNTWIEKCKINKTSYFSDSSLEKTWYYGFNGNGPGSRKNKHLVQEGFELKTQCLLYTRSNHWAKLMRRA